MAVQQSGRSARAFGLVATVTAAIPLCLTACAPAAQLGVPASELSAAADSDLLATPTEHVYRVTDVQLVAPIDTSALGANMGDRVTPSGTLVVADGVITEAELSVVYREWTEATFVLTEPTVLRREGSADGTVTATGTLSVNGIEQPGTGVRLTPGTMTADRAEFDVSFTVPDNLLIAGGENGSGEVTAHVVLSAERAPGGDGASASGGADPDPGAG